MSTRTLQRIGIAAMAVLTAAVWAAWSVLLLYGYYSAALPDHQNLADHLLSVTTHVDASDGRRIAEFAVERRELVALDKIPPRVVNAFLAAEDKNFYEHPGVDLWAVARAGFQNFTKLGDNRRPVGASTITQQVAKRLFLSNELSITRKVREIILAYRLERDFSKREILELYLNEIYLGRGAYGVVAAAQTYFGKPLEALSIAEAAYLAALPKAPNNYNPARFADAARARRDWVVLQMQQAGFVTADEATAAAKAPLAIQEIAAEDPVGGYFTEEVRRELVARFGNQAVYRGGLTVHTTLDPVLQTVADRALRAGLVAYDRRHGWRGRVGRIELAANVEDRGWARQIAAHPLPIGAMSWKLAVVLAVDDAGAVIGLASGTTGRIPFAELRWARPTLKDQKVGPSPRRAADVLARGDVILVEAVDKGGDGRSYPADSYALRQIPDVSGALVALDPQTGTVLAMSGGLQFERNRDEFNRATQARRQPGSAFKPFVYLAALNQGYTPSTLVLDAPIAIAQGGGLGDWEPENYDGTSLGLRPLRVGLELSRNQMTVRLAQRVGMARVAATAERYGIVDRLGREPAMALGAGETTLLRMVTAYAQLANGGVKIAPALIDWVRDRHGELVYDRAALAPEPQSIDDPRSVFQVVTMLRGVIERGTAGRAGVLGRAVYGKTGTTNDEKDAWFIGFTTGIVCGVYVGFDQPRTLGAGEQGASVALPIFIDFMKEALKELPATPILQPRGIVMARVRDSDGQLAEAWEGGTLMQPFKTGTLPTYADPVVDDSPAPPPPPALTPPPPNPRAQRVLVTEPMSPPTPGRR